jgi:ADP-ribose pyrophosphatase YjhB (NUDIX family)
METTPLSYSIFYNSSVIFLSEKFEKREGLQACRVSGKKDVEAFFEGYFKNQLNPDFVLFGYNKENMFHDVKECFNYVDAAGGLVQNKQGHYLFIRRLNVWDLPKGKAKKDETPEECALREVTEETAVTKLSIIKELQPTYHIYFRNEKKYLKKTHWFSMITASGNQLVPQTEEEIELAVWLDKPQSVRAINQSYRSLKDTFLNVIKG